MEGFPGLVGESSQTSRAIRKAYEHARAEHSVDDPEPGPMLRIIVSRGLDPDTGVGRSADRTPTIFIFLDAKGTLHSLEPITMASMTRGYPSDITARAP